MTGGYKKEGKPDYSLLHKSMFDPTAQALEYGAGKHGRNNYLDNPEVTDQELVAAARRHILETPDSVDEESGLPHLAHAAANIAMLFHRRAERKGK